MERSPLSLASDDVRFCVIGTVTIHPTAAIATDVVLRANPGSSLVIGAGVVIGQGCILHAQSGTLVLEDGVTLGTQVLMFGRGRIGEKACVGSFSTLMVDIDVLSGVMVPARSLLDTSAPRVIPSSNAPEVMAEPKGTESGSADDPSYDLSKGPDVGQRIDPSQDDRVRSNPADTNKVVDADGLSASQGECHPKDDGRSPANGLHSVTSSGNADGRADDSAEGNGRSGSHNMFMPLNTPRYSTGTAHVSPNSLHIPGLDDHHASSANGQSLSSSSKYSEQDPATSEPSIKQNGKDGTQDPVEESKAERKIEEELSPRSVVYGKSSVQRLMTMMFPYRTLNNSGDEKE